MRRKAVREAKAAYAKIAEYEKSSGKKLKDNPELVTKIMLETLISKGAVGGLRFIPTVGSDEDYTCETPGDVRPVVFSFLSKDDGLIYNVSALFAATEAAVKKRLAMNPFPVSPEDWEEILEGDVLDSIIMTPFNFEGEPYSFREEQVGEHTVTLAIRNMLSPEVPPEFADSK